jgi:hypothetical protein
MITIASIAFSLINARARSCRTALSSRVMGLASLFLDFKLAIDGGRGEPGRLSAAEDASREGDAAATPATVPPTSRNRRREIMKPPGSKMKARK